MNHQERAKMLSKSISADFTPEFNSEYDSALKLSDSDLKVDYPSELTEIEYMECNY